MRVHFPGKINLELGGLTYIVLNSTSYFAAHVQHYAVAHSTAHVPQGRVQMNIKRGSLTKSVRP